MRNTQHTPGHHWWRLRPESDPDLIEMLIMSSVHSVNFALCRLSTMSNRHRFQPYWETQPHIRSLSVFGIVYGVATAKYVGAYRTGNQFPSRDYRVYSSSMLHQTENEQTMHLASLNHDVLFHLVKFVDPVSRFNLILSGILKGFENVSKGINVEHRY
jgi:hypothetical protein